MNFIQGCSDLNTINYLSKSLNSEVLEKALDHTKLVQKDITVKGKNGKIFTRKQWVSMDDNTVVSKPTKPVSNSNQDKPTKRKQLEATPFTITDKLKHLVKIEEVSEVPEHIKSLAIPPTWRNVMISPDPNAEVLAIGKDDMNRPQYLYSEEHWDRVQKQKFERVQNLIQRQDTIAQVIDMLEDRDTSDCLKLIHQMGIRPGSTRDTKSKVEALGATTLRGENVVVESNKVYLRFTGKDGVNQDHIVPNDDLGAMLLERKQESGDNGRLFNTSDVKLRDALKPLGIHPKDLRTMLATTTATQILSKIPSATNVKDFIKVRNQVGDIVCGILGNRREMSLGSYIDPNVFRNWSPEIMTEWEQSSNTKKSPKRRTA